MSPKNNDNEPARRIHHVSIEPGAEIDFVKGLTDKFDAAQTSSTAHSDKILFWTKISGVLLSIYALLTFWQAWQTHDAVKAARDANRIAEDSIRANITLGDYKFVNTLAEGHRVAVSLSIKNIGRSSVLYGIGTRIYRWEAMPEGEIPVEVPSISTLLQPDTPTIQTMYDTRALNQFDIAKIPTMNEVVTQTPTHEGTLVPPSRAIIYIVGKLVYDSLGRRREIEFCSYIVHTDSVSNELGFPPQPGDPNYTLLTCPKWNATKDYPIPQP